MGVTKIIFFFKKASKMKMSKNRSFFDRKGPKKGCWSILFFFFVCLVVKAYVRAKKWYIDPFPGWRITGAMKEKLSIPTILPIIAKLFFWVGPGGGVNIKIFEKFFLLVPRHGLNLRKIGCRVWFAISC